MSLIKIDDFLKKVSKKIENGSIEQDVNSLHSEIISFTNGGIEVNSNDNDGDLFKKLKEFNKILFLYPHINENRKYFNASNLNVNDSNKLKKKITDGIKLAVSLHSKNAETSIKKIMYFLAMVDETKKPIEHNLEVTKIGDRVNININVFSLQDAQRIISYFNKDSSLSDEMLDASPLVPNIGKIGLFYEEMLSYDMVFLYWLEEYFKNRKEHNLLDKVDSEDFLNFIQSKFKATFQKGRGFSEFLSSKNHGKGKKDFYNDNLSKYFHLTERLISFCNITDLLIKVLEGKTFNAEILYNIRTNQDIDVCKERLTKIRASRTSITNEQVEKFKSIIDTFCIEKFNPLLASGETEEKRAEFFEYFGMDPETYCKSTGMDLNEIFLKEETYVDYIRNLIKNDLYSSQCPFSRLHRNLRQFSLDGNYSAFDQTETFSKDNLLSMKYTLEEEYGMPLTKEEIMRWTKSELPYLALGKRLKEAGLTGDMVESIRTNIMIESLKTFTKSLISYYINNEISAGISVSQALTRAKNTLHNIINGGIEPISGGDKINFEEAIIKFGLDPTWEMMFISDENFATIMNLSFNLQNDKTVDKAFPNRPIIWNYNEELLCIVKKVFDYEPDSDKKYITDTDYEKNIINLFFAECAKELLETKNKQK